MTWHLVTLAFVGFAVCIGTVIVLPARTADLDDEDHGE
jgi:hypothetical protein